MNYKKLTLFANWLPFKPEDIDILVMKGQVVYKPKKTTAKMNHEIYRQLGDIICGAVLYQSWEDVKGEAKE